MLHNDNWGLVSIKPNQTPNLPRKISRWKNLLACLFAGLMSLQCGVATTFPQSAAATSCQPGAAEILVGDGFLKILCGCTLPSEAPGTILPAPGNLVCHVGRGTSSVLFHFVGNYLQHQIVPKEDSIFASTPVITPNGSNQVQIYAVEIPGSATTYKFMDSYSGMMGQIITP